MVAGASDTSIAHVLKTIFPRGTYALDDDTIEEIAESGAAKPVTSAHGAWETIPFLPYDVFAFCAHVVHITGLMGYFDPDPDAPKTFGKGEPLRVVLDKSTRKKLSKSAASWRENSYPDDHAQRLWRALYKDSRHGIRLRSYQRLHKEAFDNNPKQSKAPAPYWWSAIIQLLIIADEACDGIGHFYSSESDGDGTFFAKLASTRIRKSRTAERPMKKGRYDMVRAQHQLATLAAAADRSVVCVQPKGRVAEVGCTLRNISRNLSLTGPVGSVRCSWQQLAGEPKGKSGDTLDILLIPFPFEMSALSFEPSPEKSNPSKWGNFTLRQDWLLDRKTGELVPEKVEELRDLVRNLIRSARRDVKTVNAVIFPEYSLTFDLFETLMEDVHDATDGRVEFMIAGSSSNCDGESDCNCVLTAIWEDQLATVDPEKHGRRIRMVSQKKHHRWKLDRSQIASYGLASSLQPNVSWWERHNIDQRELNFFQFRKDAVFASLICEDLARNDPCHEILRSVAPNLVFSLLMDGPQLGSRWSARYASTLADDPGCAVLTFTSKGLVDRSNANSTFPASQSVGLLRDSNGITREINLPSGQKGVLLTLGSQKTIDNTIDGRETTNASSWHFISQKAISP